LANYWNFPEVILRVVRYYAEPLNPNACALAPIVYIAVHISDGMLKGETSLQIVDTLNAEVASVLKVNQDEWIEKVDSYQSLVQEAESYLQSEV
jgi:HD-like signal output (HDOD) protein